MARVGSRRFARLLAAATGTLPGLAMLPAGAALAACPAAAPFDQQIAEAAARFALPASLVRAVISVESNFVVGVVSPKGAMGLMQVMPGTWEDLRLRHGLGPDPFDPCDNILAGTAYLREMLDRYGDPGFLAAYNAGPGRYEAYIRGARPLPIETVAYVERVTSRMADGAPVRTPPRPDPDAWRRGGLFVGAAKAESESPPSAPTPPSSAAAQKPDSRPVEPMREALFVARTGVPK